MIGQRIGSYRIVRELGSGAMASVYEGVGEPDGRQVAIKVLSPQHSADPEVSARFFQEARIVSVINHPGLVGIYDHGRTPDGQAYLVMELLAGKTLRQRLSEGPPLRSAGLALVLQTAQALAAMHGKQVIHRDLKPDNIMLLADTAVPGGLRVKLLDFGVAKMNDSADGDGDSIQTRTGMLVGTPTYMSPEQCRSQRQIDGKSDVYALGVISYELLTGAPPFRGSAIGELITLHLTVPPRALRDVLPAIPDDLEKLVLRMLAKKPEERPSAEQVAAQLQRIQVADERLERSDDSEDHTQAAMSEEDISSLALQVARLSQEHSIQQRVESPAASGPSRWGAKRRALVMLGCVALLLAGATIYWLRHRGPASITGPTPVPLEPSLVADAGSGSRDMGVPPDLARSSPASASEPLAPPTQEDDDPLLRELRGKLAELSDKKALRLLKRTLKQHPKHAALYELLCEVQQRLNKSRDATKSCKRALALDPERKRAQSLLQTLKGASREAESSDE